MTKDPNEVIQPRLTEDLKELVPSMNVGLPAPKAGGEDKEIVSDTMLLGIYGEILEKIREDRGEIDGVLTKFLDMVLNDGDSTTSSKEALVSLLQMKTDQSDKMAKVADLMTRVKLKEKDTFPRYMAASQTNTINIGGPQKRALLEAINNMKKGKNDEA